MGSCALNGEISLISVIPDNMFVQVFLYNALVLQQKMILKYNTVKIWFGFLPSARRDTLLREERMVKKLFSFLDYILPSTSHSNTSP